MRIFSILTLFFIVNSCIGQIEYNGKVIDAISNQPISEVNITVGNSNVGTTTDKNGEFQFSIKQLPTTIFFSHIGYETETRIPNRPTDNIIYLLPKTNVLDEITISAAIKIDSLSSLKECSISDFEIHGDHIYKLEYHGSFKKNVISISNLAGELITTVAFEKRKQFQELHKCCTGVVYALTNNNAYPIKIIGEEASFAAATPLETFNHYIRPCKLYIEKEAYHLGKKQNGLVDVLSRYNSADSSFEIIKTISDKTQVEHYESDLSMIRESQSISTITTTKVRENEKIRRLQAEGDFLSKVFYKPEFPIFIFDHKNQVVLLNHIENKIETFENKEVANEVTTHYVSDPRWLKNIAIDAENEKAYGLFNFKKGIAVKEINIETGETAFVALLDIPISDHRQIKIANNVIYFLKEIPSSNSAKILLSQRI